MVFSLLWSADTSFSFVANRFNVVSVRVKNECAVVVWVIVRTRSRRTIVARSGSQSCVVKSVNRAAVVTCKRHMDRSSATARHVSFRLRAKADRPTLLDPEIRNELSTKPCTRGSFHSERITQRRQRRFIELLAALIIRNTNTDMVKHQGTPFA